MYFSSFPFEYRQVAPCAEILREQRANTRHTDHLGSSTHISLPHIKSLWYMNTDKSEQTPDDKRDPIFRPIPNE